MKGLFVSLTLSIVVIVLICLDENQCTGADSLLSIENGLIVKKPLYDAFHRKHLLKRSFYEDPDNFGYYAYHGNSNSKRDMNDFEHSGEYKYHGLNEKRSTDMDDFEHSGKYAYHGLIEKRSAFYEDPANFGYYAYHGNSNAKRSTDMDDFEHSGEYKYHGKKTKRSGFYEDPANFGYYAYHGNSNTKRSTDMDDFEHSGEYKYHGLNEKRSTDIDDFEHSGEYKYHGKKTKRSGFYEDPANFGYYAYHGNSKRSILSHLNKRKTILKHEDFINITSCQYRHLDSMLVCSNNLIQNKPVECRSSLNISDLSQFEFNMFGIETTVDNTSSTKRFNLYPFKMNDKTHERVFYNYQIALNEKQIKLALYHSDHQELSGFNVESKQCFDSLSDLLEKSSKLKTIDFKISSKNALTKILFIGDIFVSKKTVL